MRIHLPGALMRPFVLLAVASIGVPAQAQSLAEVARQEDYRRRAAPTAGKVYTNDNLAPVAAPPAPKAVNPADVPSADAPPIPPVVAPTAGTVAPAAGEPVKDEAYWRGRLQSLRQRLDQDLSSAEAMQNRADSLTFSYTARSDAGQRVRIGVERQKALANLDRLKIAAEASKTALAAAEEEARRAGVPAGWLR